MFQPEKFSRVQEDDDSTMWERRESVNVDFDIESHNENWHYVYGKGKRDNIIFMLIFWRDTGTYRLTCKINDETTKMLADNVSMDNESLKRLVNSVYKNIFQEVIEKL